jgi:hypothetical protein
MLLPILEKSLRRVGRSAVLLTCTFLGAAAWAGSPRVSFTYPAGAQRGGEMEVTCSGSNLEDVKSFLFDEPGFESQILTTDKGKFTAKIKVAPDVRLGEHTFRVVTASGVADLRLFYVSPFPMVAEAESKVRPKPAQHVELGTTVYGHTPDDAQVSYEVDLKKGQRLSVEVIGLRLHTGSVYDPKLTITKDGTIVADVDDTAFTRQDPVASILAPDEGKYVITVKDATNSGPGPCHYLMNIGTFARPLAVYPAGGPAGENLKVKLLGDASGPIEQTVKLPDQANDRYPLLVNLDQPTPQPNYMHVSNFPNVLEAKPNNDTAHATEVTQAFPAALNGIVETKGDVSYFKFKAKKDEQYDFTVFARRLNSPLDSVLDIYNDKGSRLGTNDDSGGPDSYLRWKAPADGQYFVSVHDQLNRGGPTFIFRLEVTPVQPKLTAWLPEMTINQNQDRRAVSVPKGNRYATLVRIKRADLAGEVKIASEALPAGVTTSAPTFDKSVDTIPMVFEATADAAMTAKAFEFKPELTEPPKDAKPTEEVEHMVDIVENGNQRPYYIVREHSLPIAVTEEIPVKISLVQPKVPLLQTGSMNLKVVAERKGDFKGAITIALLYSPPGFGNAGLQQIKENENEGFVTISANANAPLQKWKVCVVGSADFGKGPIWFSTQLVEIEVAPPLMGGQIVRTFVDQGDTTTMTVKLDPKAEFEGKAKLQLLGLPPSTTADDVEITKDDKEAKFTVKADKVAPAGQHKQLFCQVTAVKDGEPMVSTFGNGGILRVDKATVAKADVPQNEITKK